MAGALEGEYFLGPDAEVYTYTYILEPIYNGRHWDLMIMSIIYKIIVVTHIRIN